MPLPTPSGSDFTVTPDQLRQFLGAPADSFDSDRAEFILSLAISSCLLVVSPLTQVCLPTVVAVAARAFVNPANVFSESDVGAFAQFGASAGGLRILPSERAALLAASGTSGAFSIDLAPAVINTVPYYGPGPWL